MHYTIQFVEPLFVVKTGGNMTGEDFVVMAKELLNHIKFKKNTNVLFDHRELNFEQTALNDLELIRAFHSKNEADIGRGKSAMLLKAGYAEKWDKLWLNGTKIQTANQVKLFENYNDAFRWACE